MTSFPAQRQRKSARHAWNNHRVRHALRYFFASESPGTGLSQRAKSLVKSTVYSIIPPPPASYSQAGEDAIMRFLFADRGIRSISYLDIGTSSPIYGNNTYLFYAAGSHGVCVEADTTLISDIVLARPRDKVVNAGVCDEGEAEMALYVFESRGLNTFDKSEAEKRTESGKYKLKEIIPVRVLGINSIIQANFESYPELLSIDIEGLDLPVLQSLNFEKYPIPVICVETCVYSEDCIRPKNHLIIDFMLSKGYEVYADTYINTIFVNKAWFYHQR